MGRSLVVAVLAVAGLLCAAGIGVAAYYVSRDSVGRPGNAPSAQAAGAGPGPSRDDSYDAADPDDHSRRDHSPDNYRRPRRW